MKIDYGHVSEFVYDRDCACNSLDFIGPLSRLLRVLFLMSLRFTVAAAQGVRPEQIIFTDVAAKNEHIRRSELADLFLDT